jgi:uncharacterized membrane protein (UPF0127 family)
MRTCAIAILCSAALFGCALCGCTSSKKPGTQTSSERFVPTKPNVGLPTGLLVLHGGGKSIRIQVEICRTAKERATGMMFRKELGALSGMLFVFEKQDNHSFWMQNTYLPLDMIFIDKKLRVVGIIENAEPLTTRSRVVDEASTYVLEVNGGFARARGVKVGAKVELPEGV